MILNNTRRPPPHLLNVRRIPLVLSVAGNIARCFSRVCLHANDELRREINILNCAEILKLSKILRGSDKFNRAFHRQK